MKILLLTAGIFSNSWGIPPPPPNHVHRQENRIADKLAKEGAKLRNGLLASPEAPPIFVQDLLNTDLDECFGKKKMNNPNSSRDLEIVNSFVVLTPLTSPLGNTFQIMYPQLSCNDAYY